MSGPNPAKVAGRAPCGLQLEAGKTYAWCTCGRSATQPWCDGAHRGTGLAPRVFKAESSAEAWLCLCKQTGTAPFCDGTHSSLPAGVSELPAP